MDSSGETSAPDASADPVDLGRALAAMDGDREILADVVAVFLDDCPGRLAALTAAVEHGSLVEAAEAAHALKGALGAVGAHGAHGEAVELERLARAGDLTGLRAAAGSFAALVERALAFLAARDLRSARESIGPGGSAAPPPDPPSGRATPFVHGFPLG